MVDQIMVDLSLYVCICICSVNCDLMKEEVAS